jgi:dTDP-4-dehydrorhamnose 3,5-epimerase
VPPGVVYAYKNVSSEPGLVFNCPNRLYKGPGRKEPVDEIRHEEEAGSVYVLD